MFRREINQEISREENNNKMITENFRNEKGISLQIEWIHQSPAE